MRTAACSTRTLFNQTVRYRQVDTATGTRNDSNFLMQTLDLIRQRTHDSPFKRDGNFAVIQNPTQWPLK